MIRFAPYVFKTLWRHRTRSLLTVSGTAVALFVFCMVGAVQEGLERLTSDEAGQRTLVVFQENRFCPTSSRLPEDYARIVGKVPGVRDVVPIQVWTNNCRASLDVVVFQGIRKPQLRTARKLEVVAGDVSEFDRRHDAALVGRSVAQRRGLHVGDQFTIGPISVKVAAIVASATPAEDNLIFTGLEFLQNTRGLGGPGVVTMHEVQLAASADPDQVALAIDQALRSGPVATTTRPQGAFQVSTLSDLVDLIGFAHWLGYGCVGLVLALVSTTIVMSVQDRIQEHAVLQAIGVRPVLIFGFVMSECLILSIGGGIIGVLFATLLLAFGGLAVGAEAVTIAFRPSLQLALVGTGISFAVGALGGCLPALQAARTPIAIALRP